MSTFKKVYLIIFLFVLSLFVSLPKDLPVDFKVGNFPVKFNIHRPDITINWWKINIQKNLDLVLGLDLAGGSHLVFEADLNSIPLDKQEAALDSLRNVMEKRVNLFGISEPNVTTSRYQDKERVVVELPGVKDTETAISIIGQTASLIFAEIGEGEKPEITETDLTGADLKSAAVAFDQNNGKPSVAIEFTTEGSSKFEKLTEKNINKALPILLDGQIVSAPVVQEKIMGGKAQITGNFTLDEAKNLSIQLNAGALPVPVRLVEQRTVGATLGKESIAKSVKAGLVGLSMVMFFMVAMYGKMGLIADIALLVFGCITLALYRLVPVVLTLPGIAGFLLSVGMAVDSNILIFERFKEERKRRDFANALEVAFGRAWDSIRDANIATLVTAFILANPLDFSFLHSSGPVRGFAITLALGIAISLFTGIFVSRNLLRLLLVSVPKRKGGKGND